MPYLCVHLTYKEDRETSEIIIHNMGKPRSFEIVAGSYEQFLIGYSFSSKENELVQSFAAHDHAGSVRCVTVCDHLLASGSTDDRIVVYDMKSRKELCMFAHHDATINCIQFTHNHTHLMSGSADGVLAIAQIGNNQVEKVWEKAHKGAAILDIAIHSSGKLALTLGANATLCTWNLIKGRQAYIINLNSKCKDPRSLEKIVWALDDNRFILYGGKYTEIWSIETGGVLKQIEHKEKVTSLVWLSDEQFLVGYENGAFSVVNSEDGSMTDYEGHANRIKGIAVYKKWIVSASSNGEIKVWTKKKFEEVAKTNSGCRITSLCLIPHIQMKEETGETVTVEEETGAEEPRVTEARVQVIVEEGDGEDGKPNEAVKKRAIKKRRTTEQVDASIEEGGENYMVAKKVKKETTQLKLVESKGDEKQVEERKVKKRKKSKQKS